MLDSVFKIIFVMCFIAASAIRAPYVRRSRRIAVAKDYTPRMEWLPLTIVFVGMQAIPFLYIVTGWLDFADYRLPSWFGFCGAAVFVYAVWFLWRSHVDLGNNFSPKFQIRQEHSLVTSGVYSRVRHPMYTAHLLWAIAQLLLFHNWIAGPAFLLTIVPLLLFRIPREERMMLELFGDEYSVYMDRTGRLFPHLK
jgi:protein-S-isoprenylcysteine O-methyltransferase Ste14